MEETTKGVEEVVQTAPAEQSGVESQPPKVEEQPAPAVEEVKPDYKALYEQTVAVADSLLDENEKITSDRDNYRKGLLAVKSKQNISDEEIPEENVIQELVKKEISRVMAKSVIEDGLRQLSGDPYEQKLIKYHYDNSIRQSGSSPEAILADLENAKLIANKGSILKTSRELKTALQNRSQISNTSSSGSEKPESVSQFFTAEQLKDLKSRGWNDKKIEAYKKNLETLKNRSKI